MRDERVDDPLEHLVCDLRRGDPITVDGDLLMEDGKLLV